MVVGGEGDQVRQKGNATEIHESSWPQPSLEMSGLGLAQGNLCNGNGALEGKLLLLPEYSAAAFLCDKTLFLCGQTIPGMSKASLDGALITLVRWKVSQPMVERDDV